MGRCLHLDVTGGIAGDMFVATMLCAFPDFRAQMEADLEAAGVNQHVRLDVNKVRESGFAALRVDVHTHSDAPPTSHWKDIRENLQESALAEPVKAHALAIFTHLAQAEAVCHGVEVDAVHFHEIADWDSLADVVAAASLITQCAATNWSVSALPLGTGRVKTRHGLVPVPAPATAELLKGYEMFTDTATGERITPTGAAILRHLAPAQSSSGPRGRIERIGIGAGRRSLEGVANILRVLVFESADQAQDHITEITFEIDDMTPEELGISLDNLRATQGVQDVHLSQGFGKKGRPTSAIRLLVAPSAQDAAVNACFEETSTIGLRLQTLSRQILRREYQSQNSLPLKAVTRPGGDTRKVESDALADVKTLKARRALARASESAENE